MKLKKLLSTMMITSIVSTCFIGNNHAYAESLMNDNIEEIFVAKMPQGLSHFTTQAYKNKVYLFGGRTQEGGIYQQTAVNIYDMKTGVWSTGQDIPMDGFTGARFSTVLYKGNVYTISPANSGMATNILKYNLELDTWTTETTLSSIPYQFIEGTSLTAINDKLYVVGGFMRQYAFTYDLNTKVTTDIAKAPRDLKDCSSLVYKNKLYVVGNFSSVGDKRKIPIYDLTTNTWSYTADIPSHVSSPFAFRQDNYIYIVDQNGNNSRLQVYDMETDTWNVTNFVSNLNVSSNSGFALNGELYLLGGSINGSNTLVDDMYKYKIGTSSREDLAYDLIEKIEEGEINKIKELESLINQLPDSPEKESLVVDFEDLKANLPDMPDIDMTLERKNVSSNLDIYIKSQNMLSLSLDTNVVEFTDYSGVEDMEKANAVNITISSSLPYSLSAYMPVEIANSDKSKTLPADILNIKESNETDYKQFANTVDKVVLKDNCVKGNDIVHSLDLKLSSSQAHQADVYKTTIKLEAEQK